MRQALAGVPENQMPMPEGIVSQLIDRETGCPAGFGQQNVTFEIFRVDNVPDCDTIEDVPDVFNDMSDPAVPEQAEPEPLF